MKGFLFLFSPFFSPSFPFLASTMLKAQGWIGGDRLIGVLGVETLSIIIISLSLLLFHSIYQP